MKRDVFISYSHKDKTVADAVCHHFEHNKIKCWMAPRDIKPGDDWATSIAEAIPSCRVMLIVFSSHSNMSKQVLREVELAVNRGLTILPVRIEDIMPTGGMQYYLSTVHWIDAMDKDMESNLTGLSETVGNLISGEKIGWDTGAGLPQMKQSKMPVWLWGIIGTAALAVILLFAFRGTIFGGAKTSLDASNTSPTEQVVITAEPADGATPAPTAEPTPAPTATVDPNASDDYTVTIEDPELRKCILVALENLGQTVEGSITAGDMAKIEKLYIISYEYSFSYNQTDPNDPNYQYNSAGVQTLEGLQYAVNLEHLIVYDQHLKDISALSQISNLKKVDLNSNDLTDISALASHMGMTDISLKENSRLSDISPLSSLMYLQSLDISGTSVEDFTALYSMYNLTDLSITEMLLVKEYNLGFINSSKMPKLNRINLSRNSISNLRVLTNQRDLEEINMSYCRLEDISDVYVFSDLKTLLIDGNITVEGFDALLKLDNIELVVVSKNIYDNNLDTVAELQKKGCEVRIFD